MKIEASYVFPPIPVRSHDWCAHMEGHEEDGKYGYGATEEEAVRDLIDSWGGFYCNDCGEQMHREDMQTIKEPHGELTLTCHCLKQSVNIEAITHDE